MWEKKKCGVKKLGLEEDQWENRSLLKNTKAQKGGPRGRQINKTLHLRKVLRKMLWGGFVGGSGWGGGGGGWCRRDYPRNLVNREPCKGTLGHNLVG